MSDFSRLLASPSLPLAGLIFDYRRGLISMETALERIGDLDLTDPYEGEERSWAFDPLMSPLEQVLYARMRAKLTREEFIRFRDATLAAERAQRHAP